MWRRRILEVEVLETRQALSDVTGTTTVLAPPPAQSTVPVVIDPTLVPATNASTLQVYVTAVGPTVNGSVSAIAVDYVGGVVMPTGGAPLALQVGGHVYSIDSTIFTASGMQLTVLSGVAASDISVGSSALLLFGPTSAPPPAVLPPSPVPPVPPDPIAMAGTIPPIIAPPPPVVSPPPPPVVAPPVIAPPEIAPSPPGVVPAGYAPPPVIMPPPAIVPPVDPTTMPFPQ